MKLTVVRGPGLRTPAGLLSILEPLAHRLRPSWLEVQLVLSDNELLQELNRDYRGRNLPTDVLSFLYATDKRQHDETPHAEIYVSLPQARCQAREHSQTLIREVVLLALHGLLHLQGQDHETSLEIRHMLRAEEPHIRWLQRICGWQGLTPMLAELAERSTSAEPAEAEGA